MKPHIGLITIGQSPRVDITPHIANILGPQVDITEIGALDDVEDPLRSEYRYRGEPGPVFATRLRNGDPIEVSESALLPLIRNCVSRLQTQGIAVFGLLCTGEYHALDDIPGLVRPYGLLHRVTDSLISKGKLGIMIPTPHQTSAKRAEWRTPEREAFVCAASPYRGDQEIGAACVELRAAGVDMIVMDCLGYSWEMKARVRAEVGVPVIMAGSLLAWALKELI